MEAVRRLREPPRLRTLGEDQARRSTWLELFFDLVFVVAVAQLGQQLSEDVTAEGLFRFLGFSVPVWWAWMGFTFYANRFDTDDLPYRLLIFVAMLGVAALATTLPDAFAGGGIDDLYGDCQARDIVHPNAPLEEQPWGFREFAVRDHDGNLVTFFEPPAGYDPRSDE